MNLSTGIFTVPKSGIYFFYFQSLRFLDPHHTRIDIYVNSYRMVSNYNYEMRRPLISSAILKLHGGAQVRVVLASGSIQGDYTYFMGILLEENLF